MDTTKNSLKLAIEVEYSLWSQPFLDVVYNCDLNLADKEQADILVKAAGAITEADLNSGQKIIALEKTDGGVIVFRSLLKHPSILRYVKSSNYKSFDLHNMPTVGGRFFTGFLPHKFDLQAPDFFITRREYDKIVLGWNFSNHAKLKDIRSLEHV